MTTLDVSIYDYSTFDAHCFAANGVERLVVGSSNYAASREMVRQAREAGITVEDLYGFIYYGLAYESRDLDNCLMLAAEVGGIQRIWLDCESGFSDDGVENDTEAPGVNVQYRMAKTIDQRNRVLAAGYQPGIYTGVYWWQSKMGNSTAFADLPLWLANYGTNDPNDPREPITTVNFGGWTDVAAHQYSSTIGLCGRSNRDNNYWFMEDSVPTKDFEDLVLATFSGSEDRDAEGKTLPREQRLPIALERMRNRADGGFGSVADRAESAYVIAQQGGAGGGIAPHTHVPGGVQ